jgi:hypothetical protein
MTRGLCCALAPMQGPTSAINSKLFFLLRVPHMRHYRVGFVGARSTTGFIELHTPLPTAKSQPSPRAQAHLSVVMDEGPGI